MNEEPLIRPSEPQNYLLVEGNDDAYPHAQQLIRWIRKLFDLEIISA